MANTLTPTDRRVIAIAIVVAAVSLGIGVKYFSHAFPEAAIEFRVNRDDSAPLALNFLTARGFAVPGYRHAAVFDYDDEAKVYLERTQGLKRMNSLTRGPIRLWHWSHRWFIPLQKEEFRVDVSPDGQVVGFDHELLETAPGANLEPATARTLAERFLVEAMHRDLASLEFVDATTVKRQARTDHAFVWKQKDVDLGEGSLRLEVEVDGEQIADYREFVKIPEGWMRDYQNLRSRNNSAQEVDEFFWILLCIAGIAILILRLRDHDVPMRLAAAFGLVATVLYFLGQLNTFSVAEFGYQTTDSYSTFVSTYMRDNLLLAFAYGTAIFLLLASAEPVYRASYPNFISLRRYFSWNGLRSRSFFIANLVGVALTFFFFAYQTVFYLAANRLGAWAPVDVPFSDLLNTRFPWVTVLFIGFFPAVSEEIQFRAFAIPFLRRFLKSGPVAVVLAAFIWGFLHSAYPNQPFFIRGLEVGLGGIIVGLIMLRFGILATLIWHYSVDALYTAFLLLRSPNHYLMVSGGVAAGIMLIPLIVAGVAYWRTGFFSEEGPLTNAAEGVVRAAREERVEAETPLVYVPLSQSRLALAGILTVGFVVLARVPAYEFGKGIVLRQSPSDAVLIADQFLSQRGIDPASYQHVVWVDDNVDPLAVRYLVQRRPLKEADLIYRQATCLALWKVRYFRSLQKEEHWVYIDPGTGKVFGYHHVLGEDMPGASLSPDRALDLGGQAVREHGYRLEDFDLQSSDATKRKAREDYTLVWEANPGDPRNVGDARYRLEAQIAGDQVITFARLFKLPEVWEREQQANHLSSFALNGVYILLVMAMVAAGVILFVRQVRSGRMPWKRSAKYGVWVGLFMFVATANQWPTFDQKYDTSISLASYHLQIGVSLIVVPLVMGLLAWLAIGLAASYYPDAWKFFHGSARRVWRRDALVATVLSLSAAVALARLDAHLANTFHAYAPISVGIFPPAFNTLSPVVGFFLPTLTRTLVYAALAGLAIVVARVGWQVRAWWLWAAIVLILVSLGPTHPHSLAAFALAWLSGFLELVVAVGLAALFMRDNILAYLMAFLCVQLIEPLVALFSQPDKFFHNNGVVLACLAAAVLLWMVWVPGGDKGAMADANLAPPSSGV
jgi:membrane protease YdiL (CAAX protease family)